MSPGFRGEPSPFMGSHHSKCHTEGQTVIHSRNLFPDKGASKQVGMPSQRQGILPDLLYKFFSSKDFSFNHEVGLFV